MELGIIGLGKMGANMALRLLQDDHRLVTTDIDEDARERVAAEGAISAAHTAELIDQLGETPRIVWLMLPAGKVTESVVDEVLPLLAEGDILVDGANSNWEDSLRRGERASERGVHYVDCGVSGGVWGLESGYNLMVGGDEAAFRTLRPLLESLAAPNGYLHTGPVGSGHFVKMIHNGIEYGMMQAYGEGFEAMASFPHAHIDLPAVARLWMQGSVVRSWLLELGVLALEADPRLESIEGYVNDSGMGRWTVDYGVKHAVPMPAISAALFARFRSRQESSFAARLAAALRREFGGHAVVEKEI